MHDQTDRITHTTSFVDHWLDREIAQVRESEREKEGNTFYLWLYGVGDMVKDHSDSERGNPMPPHGLLFPISSKGSFICIILQTG